MHRMPRRTITVGIYDYVNVNCYVNVGAVDAMSSDIVPHGRFSGFFNKNEINLAKSIYTDLTPEYYIHMDNKKIWNVLM